MVEPVQPEKTSPKEGGVTEVGGEEDEVQGEDVGNNEVQFNFSDAMQFLVEEHSVLHFDIHDDTVNDVDTELFNKPVHTEMLTEPLHANRNEFKFICSNCPNKTELCSACHEIALFLKIEHNDVDFNDEHDLSVVCSEIAVSLRDPIRCDNTVVGDCSQIAGAPSIKQQSTALDVKPFTNHLMKSVFDEDRMKVFDQHKQHLTSSLILQPLHWEFPFELIWMLWLQKFHTKFKDKCGTQKRRLLFQELEEIRLNEQRLKHYCDNLPDSLVEQDVLLIDGKYPP